MIIQVRGTSGSGKSTVVRKVMDQFSGWEPVRIEGRRQPLYYQHPSGLLVLGHYEIACGGCDTIGSVPQVFAAIEQLPSYRFLICEGLLLSEDVIWSEKFSGMLRAIFLTTPAEECLRRVQQRQQEKGRKPTDPERVVRKLVSRIDRIEKIRKRLIAVGVECRRCSSEQAPRIILNWIRLHANQGDESGSRTKLDQR